MRGGEEGRERDGRKCATGFNTGPQTFGVQPWKNLLAGIQAGVLRRSKKQGGGREKKEQESRVKREIKTHPKWDRNMTTEFLN